MDELVVATSAALGQVVGTFVTFPLHVVKTRLQAKNVGEGLSDGTVATLARMLREDGVLGMLALFPSKGFQQGASRFTYYFIYQSVINRFRQLTGRRTYGTVANLCLGYVSGLLNTVFLSPLETISTRVLAAKRPTGMVAATRRVLGESGVAGFYYGWTATFYSSTNPAIQNTAYDQLKRLLLRGRPALGFAEAFWLGAFTKALATVVTYPPTRVKAMIQNRSSSSSSSSSTSSLPSAGGGGGGDRGQSSVAAVMVAIHRTEGVAGLYSGLTTTLLKGVLQAAFMLMVKERVDYATRVAFGMVAS